MENKTWEERHAYAVPAAVRCDGLKVGKVGLGETTGCNKIFNLRMST